MASRIHQVHRDQAGGAITRVKLSQDGGSPKDTAKSAVIALIRAGEAVRTAPPSGTGARVVVVDAAKPFLKTDQNGTEADDLGGLSTY
jgi:phage-related minor tail protein